MNTLANKLCLVMIFTAFCHVNINAQTNWNVTVSNFSFSPADLTIDQGDIITWNNTLGTHNVNGTTATFPNNPTSFGNAVQAAPWEYSFTFDIAGEYRFQCNPHSASMQGTITVNAATSIVSSEENDNIKIYPSPFEEYVFIELPDTKTKSYEQIQLFNMTGQMVYSKQITSDDKFQFDLGHLEPSIYFYRLQDSNGSFNTGKIIKK